MQRQIKCFACDDSGLIRIIHPETVALCISNPSAIIERRASVYSAARACSCNSGTTWSDPNRKQAVPRVSRHEVRWPQDRMNIDGEDYVYDMISRGDDFLRLVVESCVGSREASRDWVGSTFSDEEF